MEQLPGKYNNPDRTLIDEKGVITNAWETSYIVKIKEVYKGTPYDTPYDEETIVVRTWFRVGLPPLDDNTYIIESDVEEYTLTVGSEAILCLYDGGDLSVNTDKTGYGITAGSKGYFKATGNSAIYQSSKSELDLNNIKQEIADANNAKTAVADDTEKNGTETSDSTDSETELIEGTVDSEKQSVVLHIPN